jgi:hypothetical protein
MLIEIRWRCTVKSCSDRVFTDETISIILSGELDHIHETNAPNLKFEKCSMGQLSFIPKG